MLLARPVLAALLALGAVSLPAQDVPAGKKSNKAAPAVPAGPSADLLKKLEFRNIGPAIMGGRVDDVAVVEGDPSTFYVATASGGILKTINGGTTFEPVFDDQAVSSIGDLALAPSDPQVLYAGTGEPNNRQSSSWGDGVYKTTDGGKTWTNVGLGDTRHIGRVLVHPTNPDVVYVAALGHLWGPNKERGLFRSTDGGRTWTNTKFVDEDTGFVDLVMDPASPGTLYAASYQRRRTPFGFSGGGPGSAIWKTTDGGASWRRLTDGLPREGSLGRIGLAVYRRDPRILFALVEHEKEGGTYRSEDRGETWKKVSDTNPRPSYYSKIHVDPNNDQRLWVLGANMYTSEDGGKTFRSDLVQRIHGDFHALWIDPTDSDRMLLGSDGGIHVSQDRGRTWDFINTFPLAQFYEIGVDMKRPYTVYGGLQDNGSWGGPSRTLWQQGIGNEDWFRVGGGDGFFVVVDPTDPDILYSESQNGTLFRMHLKTFETRPITPEAPPGERYRFNWNSPILISPHDPETVYFGGNRLFGSKDRGETWSLVTPDLTTNVARDPMPIFGKVAKDLLSRHDGVVHYATITTVAESPLRAGVLWVGTDDGLVQVSRDGGATWTNVTAKIPGVPKGTYVSRVEASRAGEGTAYVAFDGHRADDYAPYLLRTEDFGQTWTRLTADLPPHAGTVNVVREYPRDASVLFLGTEHGLFVSWDRGGRWRRVSGKLPTVPVDDLLVHPRENDLVIGTHGRGVYILDDVAPLASLAGALPSDLRVFPVRPATQWRIYGHKGNTGHKTFLAPNPPEGALVSYSLKEKLPEKEGVKAEVKLVVKDASGATVRELKGPAEAGLHRVNWDLRAEPPVQREAGQPEFFTPRGLWVAPGTYTVTVTAGSFSESQPIVVEADPRLTVSAADRAAWAETAKTAGQIWRRADAANRAVEALRRQLRDLVEKKDGTRLPEAVTTQARALREKVDAVGKRLSRQEPQGFAGAPLAEDPVPLVGRARGLYFALNGMVAPLTPQHQQAMARIGADVDEVVAAVNAFVQTDVPALNRAILDAGVGRLDPGRAIP